MKNYIEMTLLPDVDITLNFLWEKLYQQLHLALVEIQDSDKIVPVGVAFPEYRCDTEENVYQLGSKVRLFSPTRETLEAVNINQWLSRLSDYMHISSIREVPEKNQSYTIFKRSQPKNNNHKMARRKAKREGISLEEAIAYFKSRKEQYSPAPFVRIKSLSSNNQYRLIILQEKANENHHKGVFNTYGLSKNGSTVPLF